MITTASAFTTGSGYHSSFFTKPHPTIPSITTLPMSSTEQQPPPSAETEAEPDKDNGMTEEEMAERILAEIRDGTRKYPDWYYEEFQEEEIDDVGDDDDDDDALDPETLGVIEESDYEIKIQHEFDLKEGDPDPNQLDPYFEHITEMEVDEDGVEVMYDPVKGRSNPFDERTIVTPCDSYIIDDLTRDDSKVPPEFHKGDLEIKYNADIKSYRKSLKIIQTYVDPFLDMEMPRDVALWHGYPEEEGYEEKPEHINRFTDPKDMTDFEAMSPGRARIKAVELARAKNNEWLPEGKSAQIHNAKTDIYREKGLLVGSLQKGEIDEKVVERMKPALDILGNVVDLLETNGTVFRFHYYGLIKNKRGMAAWTELLIRDCGVECTGVVFETGWRKRDPYYDGGDHFYGPY